MELIGMIVVGAVVGALARLFMKGDQGLSVLWTIILGALGAFLGGWGAGVLGVQETAGIDWIRWILSIVCAMVLISVFLGVTRKK
ncbi:MULTISPECIES: GlsB/YeaQ/YmgE family stress response membrane protein [unclassified Actinomyces]|uniref:GlsB/YeaQ/YmgE family stress response membrane protein n=1 Tax=unclassified Actinomyces TaxID=2609248 RepID=UPI002016B793|nr:MULTISPECIES: GlsB/YeaQ/YmgE family stress response membrane protein [unclassified Actinomyces]MCL3777731.1 GlsB/YeaQ/YmgE family stress response membrane protein [Actinomyces sp. AC-20-1]MCL3790464.1 GlsB/YeaQ/YmgE family stress response membrane protein [Actinomyces sp. 187325]MCL3793183.1 GlsB/YeaQ/YmgE family stress response membrane protein [Actinomyces sp. 186855]MCL3795220.1 GlsB/YeaQ/YmgE family stress response membrane protein [Actinomyces sp. 217892]